jgi:hypothetical protein
MPDILNTTPADQESIETDLLYDDCDDITSGGKFTNLTTGSGATVTADTGTGGVMILTTGGTAANISARAQTNPNFNFIQDEPMKFRTRLKFTEQATNKANIFVGFSSAFPADTLQASNLGPNTSFTGVGLFKQGNTTNWQAIVSVGTVQTIVNLTALLSLDKLLATSGGGTWTELKVEIQNINATFFDALFTIGSVLKYQILNIAYSGYAVMGAGVEIKAGAATSEILFLDRFTASQKRFAQPF